jgi:ribosomal protein S18 acetylase RimI-like enzyme
MTENVPLALQLPDPAIYIRSVRIADTSELRERCWPEWSHAAVYRLLTRARRHAQQGRGLGVVVDNNPGIVGFGQLTLWPRCGELSDLIVMPAFRRRGLGTTIIQYLVRAAHEMHAPCVEIGAALQNTGAVALYRRLGFQDSHTVMLNVGQGREAVLFLRLELTDSTIQT